MLSFSPDASSIFVVVISVLPCWFKFSEVVSVVVDSPEVVGMHRY